MSNYIRIFSKPKVVVNNITGETWLEDEIKEISASCLHEAKSQGVYWIIGTGSYCAYFDGNKWDYFGMVNENNTNFKVYYKENLIQCSGLNPINWNGNKWEF